MTRFLFCSLALLLACTPVTSRLDAAPAVDAAHPDAALAVPDAANDAAHGALDAGIDAASSIDAGNDASSDITTVHIVYPSGHTITVRGGAAPLSWTSGMAATDLGGGLYELQIHGLSATTELKPLLDDTTWSRGPNFHVAPHGVIEIAPHFTVTHGRFDTLISTWHSTTLGNDRTIYAYYPAAYDENTVAHFGVIYMHDGQNLWAAHPELAAFGTWNVDTAIDAAGESGRCSDGNACQSDGDCSAGICDTFADTIVIGIANTSGRIYEYTPTTDPGTAGGGGGDLYLQAITTELKPMIDAMLRTRPERESTSLMGSSLGGLISAYGGITHPETFGRIGAMSPSTWWNGGVLITDVSTIPTHSMRAMRVYVDSGDGTNDGGPDTAMLASTYQSVGYVEGTDFHHVVQVGAAHNESFWAMRLPGALSFLLAHRER